MTPEEEEKMIEDHAEWFAKTIKWVYKQAMRHGIKHGKEDK